MRKESAFTLAIIGYLVPIAFCIYILFSQQPTT